MQAIIVDSDPSSRQKLRELLHREPDIEITAECDSAGAAIRAIDRKSPDLVFLEMSRPQLDARQVVEAIGVELLPTAIFTSSDEQFALEAFEANAVDYLVKPFEKPRLVRALERARERYRFRHFAQLGSNMNRLVASARPGPRRPNRLVVRSQGSVYLVKVDEIDWIEAARNYVKIHCGAETHLMREPLSRLADRLDPKVFFRIHRSTLVNIDRVRKIEPGTGSEAVAELDNGTRLMISRAYRRGQLKELLGAEA